MSKAKFLNLYQLCLAEMVGTALFLFLGISSVCAAQMAGADLGLWEIAVVWGLSVSLAVYLTAGISGAHLNPAVTITLFVFAGFDRRKVLPYILSQFLGAFVGAAFAYMLYQGLISAFEIEHGITRASVDGLQTASLFSTYPHEHLGLAGAFLVEFVITGCLMCLILALTDDGNGVPKGALAPLLIGLLVAVLGAATGPLTGFAMNPARDFAPKLFTALSGWGPDVFFDAKGTFYAFVPLVAPVLGALTGGLLYRIMSAKQRAVALEHVELGSLNLQEQPS